MTIVFSWLDKSDGRNRITAIADSRVSELISNKWVPRTDVTMKLFRVSVNCHRLDEFDPNIGAWRHPYYQTEMGIGFSGYCIEAMTIISIFSRAMDQLVSIKDDPKPSPDKIINGLAEIVRSYFASHSNPATQRVQLLLFGYDVDQSPWISRIEYTPGGPVQKTGRIAMDDYQSFMIGDAAHNTFKTSINDVFHRIEKHRNGLNANSPEADKFETELEKAKLDVGKRKHLEAEIAQKARNQRLKLNRISLRADLLRDRNESSGVSFRSLMQADFVLFLRDASMALKQDEDQRWWPETLLWYQKYSGPFEIFARAESKAYFEKIKGLLAVDSREGLLTIIPMFGHNNARLHLPRWDFDSLPIGGAANIERIATKP